MLQSPMRPNISPHTKQLYRETGKFPIPCQAAVGTFRTEQARRSADRFGPTSPSTGDALPRAVDRVVTAALPVQCRSYSVGFRYSFPRDGAAHRRFGGAVVLAPKAASPQSLCCHKPKSLREIHHDTAPDLVPVALLPPMRARLFCDVVQWLCGCPLPVLPHPTDTYWMGSVR